MRRRMLLVWLRMFMALPETSLKEAGNDGNDGRGHCELLATGVEDDGGMRGGIMSTEIRYFENREDWRKWLTDNFETASDIWFVFPGKSSGEKGITYNDAVEEALCFEWIDSTIKALDKEHKIQHFTPRNPKSTYSQANKERLKWLLDNKMIHPKFEDKIRNVLSVPFVFPDDIIDRLKEDKITWKNYQLFSDAYKRIRIAYIEAAKETAGRI